MRRILLLATILLLAASSQAQDTINPIVVGLGAPSNPCLFRRAYIDLTNNALYFCGGDGNWHATASGSVINDATLSSGNIVTGNGTSHVTVVTGFTFSSNTLNLPSGAAITWANTGTPTLAGVTNGITASKLISCSSGGGDCFVVLNVPTSGPVSDPGGASAYLFNNASGALTFNAPAGVIGLQRCYRNATGKSGAITIQMAASNTVDKDGANGSSAGTLVSGGALGDAACIVSDATNHWYAYIQKGTWTNN